MDQEVTQIPSAYCTYMEMAFQTQINYMHDNTIQNYFYFFAVPYNKCHVFTQHLNEPLKIQPSSWFCINTRRTGGEKWAQCALRSLLIGKDWLNYFSFLWCTLQKRHLVTPHLNKPFKSSQNLAKSSSKYVERQSKVK